jgi:hypothetical protein
MIDSLLCKLEHSLRASFEANLSGLLANSRAELQLVAKERAKVKKERADGLGEVISELAKALARVEEQRKEGIAEVATEKAKLNEERAKNLCEVAIEQAKVEDQRIDMLAKVASERAELHRKDTANKKWKEAQEGRVLLNVGGFHFETSVQTLRRIPGTFFDAYFSGRYAQDVCADGSIFIDRDGEHFGHILEYMRDGVLCLANNEAFELDIDLLKWIKRELGYYCIEVLAERVQEVVYLVGGTDDFENNKAIASVQCYVAANEHWRPAAPLKTARHKFALCDLAGELYATGTGNTY